MKKMPIIFVGHGTPMNAIEDNEFTQNWQKIAIKIPKPRAILAISAHWYTEGSRINEEEFPRTIYDMYGFPKKLYEIKYNAPGDLGLVKRIREVVSKKIISDNSWGYDHGIWSILVKMYPEADIPIVQFSIDKNSSLKDHFQIGKELSQLRDEGILIFASGNVVHNLLKVDFNKENGFEWAERFDNYIKKSILERNYEAVIEYKRFGQDVLNSFSTPEHFLPLIYILGASTEKDRVTIFNEKCIMGALSMTSYIFQE